jgi:hypothetical protein
MKNKVIFFVVIPLLFLIPLALASCFPDIVDRGEHHPVGLMQDHRFGLDFKYQAYEITSWNGRECMFIHVVADEGDYRESLLDCED